MFLWFVFRDNRESLWQSGVLTFAGREKPSANVFSTLAFYVRGETVNVKVGRAPSVQVAVPKMASVTEVGRLIGVTWKVTDGAKFVASGQAASPLRFDNSVVFTPVFKPAAKKTYTLTMTLNDPSGNTTEWTYALQTPQPKATTKKK
jgi:hypothetical protein